MLMTTPTQENNDYASWVTVMSLALEGGDSDGFRAGACCSKARRRGLGQRLE
jgi:hypothetical protein